MAAALVVTVLIIVVAVGWFLFRGTSAERTSPDASTDTSPPTMASAPAAAAWLHGHETEIVLRPLPPALLHEVTVKGRSGNGNVYQVNLEQMSCTCPDFEKRRASLPALDIRRVCKHIGQALESTGALSHYDEVVQAIIRPKRSSGDHSIGHGVNAERFVELADGTDVLVFAFSSGNAWVDVVTRRGTKNRVKKYKRYSYNVDEQRWSYGSAPFSDAEIGRAIHDHQRSS